VTVAAVTGADGSLGRAIARRLAADGHVVAVSAGAFPTAAEQIYDDPAAYNQHVLDQQSLKRRGTPDELAAVVSFLAGPEASNASGQTIEVNGGWVMS
jgi:NAD(P)-dependent dehydrogenase (short-subunit alcohol dehydrogenase family)